MVDNKPMEVEALDFVCFLYLKTDDEDNDYLYLYFQDDIVKWKENKGKDLYIGDKEKEYDIYLLRDGRYGVMRKVRTQSNKQKLHDNK